DDEDPMRIAIDRHRKIRSCPLHRQRSRRPHRKVHHANLTCVRHIHKDLGPRVVDLKPLRMRFETDIRGFRQAYRIDHRKRTLPVAPQPAWRAVSTRTLWPSSPSWTRPIGVRPSPASTCTEPSPALATNTLSANGTYATPCGSLKPVILRKT